MNDALIIVDVWDNHWDKETKSRVGPLAKKINKFANSFRRKGGLVIHATCGVPDLKKEKNKNINTPHDIKKEKKDGLLKKLSDTKLNRLVPLDGGGGAPNWSCQNKNIKVNKKDYVTADAKEIFNLLKEKKINKLFYTGLHANICILWTREFSILQMKANGVDTYLILDLSMFLPPLELAAKNKKKKIIDCYNKNICPIVKKGSILK